MPRQERDFARDDAQLGTPAPPRFRRGLEPREHVRIRTTRIDIDELTGRIVVDEDGTGGARFERTLDGERDLADRTRHEAPVPAEGGVQAG
jgi:hypothetical protein